MYFTIYYGLVYLLSLILNNINIFKTESLGWNDNIMSIIKIVNYLSLFGYLNSFMYLIRKRHHFSLNKYFILKILFCIYNVLLENIIICDLTGQIYRCTKTDCLNNSDDSYDLIGIIIKIALLSQYIIHIIFPLYKCYNDTTIDKEDDEDDDSCKKIYGRWFLKDNANCILSLKKVFIFLNASMFYNIVFISHLPNDVYFMIYYGILFNMMIYTLSFLQNIYLTSFFSLNIVISSLASLFIVTFYNLYIIIHNHTDYIPSNINFGILLLTCIMTTSLIMRNILKIKQSINQKFKSHVNDDYSINYEILQIN